MHITKRQNILGSLFTAACNGAGSRSGQTSFDVVIGDCGIVAAASGATIGSVPSSGSGQRRGVHTAAAPTVRLTSSFLGTQQRQR